MILPILTPGEVSSDITDTFYGYNHNLKIGPGEFYDTKNLTSAYFPMLANRKKRGKVKHLTAGQGIIEKDNLCYVDNGTLYVNNSATQLTGLSAGQKQLVSMGAYIIIFPDKKYYNTEVANDFGDIEATFSYNVGSRGSVTFNPCNVDGELYSNITSSVDPPDGPTNNDLWADTSGDKPVLKQWSSYASVWTEIVTVYTKITFSSLGDIGAFKAQDGVTISGFSVAGHNEVNDLNGEKVLYGVGGSSSSSDYIIVVGLITEQLSQATGTITISRKLPAMDFVIECQNRLWGCKYGNVNGKNINELYCSALGDFKNWSQYLGLSTDSWRASIGSDGRWTGAINYLGNPTFFKENHVHIVTISATGGHRVDEMACRGVQKGSENSLQVINETLYYKGRTEIMAYQGGFPVSVSSALSDVKYYNAVAGVFGQRYYISMKDKSDVWHLFVYDADRNIWMHEDNLQAIGFARVADELYCMCADNYIYSLNGTTGNIESEPQWIAETGVSYYQYPQKKYLSRFNIRMKMASGSSLSVYLEYDSSGTWELQGTVNVTNTGTATLPVKPRRCDHLRMKLVGTGDVRIYSIAKILEVGSDV